MTVQRDQEADIHERLIGRLLEEQAPHLAGLRLVKVKDGWDNAVWRLGDVLALRITRRAVAVDLHRHEQRWLIQAHELGRRQLRRVVTEQRPP